jgi:hypothetical protein
MLAYIRRTITTTGLSVTACLDQGTYEKGERVSRVELDFLNLHPHDSCPMENYAVTPRQGPPTADAPCDS